MQYFIDITHLIPVDQAEPVEHTLALRIGTRLTEAVEDFELLWSQNVTESNIVKMCLRLSHAGSDLVLSRRTNSGQGDW